jgi:hypothetical protein
MPCGFLRAKGTHHFIFSLDFALQRMGFRIIQVALWKKNDCFSPC